MKDNILLGNIFNTPLPPFSEIKDDPNG